MSIESEYHGNSKNINPLGCNKLNIEYGVSETSIIDFNQNNFCTLLLHPNLINQLLHLLNLFIYLAHKRNIINKIKWNISKPSIIIYLISRTSLDYIWYSLEEQLVCFLQAFNRLSIPKLFAKLSKTQPSLTNCSKEEFDAMGKIRIEK